MKLSPLLVLVICSFAIINPSLHAAITLTTFGSSSSPAFNVDGSTSFGTSQAAGSIGINGSDLGGLLAGTFGPINITAETGLTGVNSVLTLSGSISGAPNSIFTVELYDAAFTNRAIYQGVWTDLTGGSAILTFQGTTGSFDFETISGLELKTAGTGSPINASLSLLQASAIPEPSRVFLIGLGGLGLAMRRRRSISV